MTRHNYYLTFPEVEHPGHEAGFQTATYRSVGILLTASEPAPSENHSHIIWKRKFRQILANNSKGKGQWIMINNGN